MLAATVVAAQPPCETWADKAFKNMSVTMGAGYSEGGNIPFTFGVEKMLEAGWAIGLQGTFMNVDGEKYSVPVKSRTWPSAVPFETESRGIAGVLLVVRIPL